MKLKNIFLSGIAIATLASCGEKMDYKEFSIYDTAYMQKKFERAGGFLSTIYADLDSDFGNYSGATLASATDESVYSHDGNAIESFFNGAWSASNPNSSIWTTCYHGIAYCNNQQPPSTHKIIRSTTPHAINSLPSKMIIIYSFLCPAGDSLRKNRANSRFVPLRLRGNRRHDLRT